MICYTRKYIEMLEMNDTLNCSESHSLKEWPVYKLYQSHYNQDKLVTTVQLY